MNTYIYIDIYIYIHIGFILSGHSKTCQHSLKTIISDTHWTHSVCTNGADSGWRWKQPAMFIGAHTVGNKSLMAWSANRPSDVQSWCNPQAHPLR